MNNGPLNARFFVRVGNPPGLDGTVSKGTGVLTWLALGALPLIGALFADEENRFDVGDLGGRVTGLLAPDGDRCRAALSSLVASLGGPLRT
jgi:hypothetical protein